MEGGLSVKCPLCEGTVVNGRCTLCGMPYRQDEMLYHLNERRSEHYRHASDKARKIMQSQQMGPTKPISRTPVKTRSVEAFAKEKVRQQQKKNNNKKVNESFGKVDRSKRKKGLKSKKIFWIIIILLFVFPSLLESIVEEIQDYAMSTYESHYEIDADPVQEDREMYFYEDEHDGGYMFYGLGAGFGTAEVGERIKPGTYGIYTGEDELVFVIENEHKNERYVLEKDTDTYIVQLEEGDQIYIEGEESEFDFIYLMEYED